MPQVNIYVAEYDTLFAQVDAKEKQLLQLNADVEAAHAVEQSKVLRIGNNVTYLPGYQSASDAYNAKLRERNTLLAELRDVLRPRLEALRIQRDDLEAAILAGVRDGLTPEVVVQRELAKSDNSTAVKRIVAFGAIGIAALLIIVLAVRYYRKRKGK